jgi:hypothetical protein
MGEALQEGEIAMNELETLRNGFVAFIDGLWWGLRDTVGALSMYEGYAGGFKQMGKEAAERAGAKGAEDAAKTAVDVLNAIGLEVAQDEKEIIVKSCPLWNRILERGLEYAFHVEEICWKPLLAGIGEIARAKPKMESALRLLYLEKAKADYKKGKAKTALEKGTISKEEYENQVAQLEQVLENLPIEGRYKFD